MKLRQKLLMDRIVQSGTVNLCVLSESFFVSDKTIRNDIREVNEYIACQEGQPAFAISKGTVSFCGDAEMKRNLAGYGVSDDYYLYRLSGEERVFVILARLICSSGYVTIESLANQLFVSRGTINSDMAHIKEWCRCNSIRLALKKSHGIRIEEEEEKKREILSKLIGDHAHIGGLSHAFSETVILNRKIWNGIDETIIKEIVLSAEEKYNFILSDAAYEELVVQIAFSILQSNMNAEPAVQEKAVSSSGQLEYQIIAYIVRRVNDCFQIQISADIAPYLAQSFYRGISHAEEDWVQDGEAEIPYIQIIAEQLIISVGQRVKFDFKAGGMLYDRLVNHLCAAIFSMKNRILISNPLSESLIEENKSLYDALQSSCRYLSQFLGREIRDEEMSYLLIYFASAIENSSRSFQSRPPVVAVLCNTGQGTAQLVVEELKRFFNFDIRCVVAVHQFERIREKQKFDFIISTIPFDASLPCVVVSPIIRRGDIESINKMMMSLGFLNRTPILSDFTDDGFRRWDGGLSKQIETLLNRNIGDERALADQLQKLLERYRACQNHPEETKEIRQPMLSELLKYEYICLDGEAKDWQDAMRLGGKLLSDHGVISEAYIEASIQNVMDSGPYIVLTKGVAIPHASKKFGVYRTAFSFLRLKTPVCFGSEKNDPVKYIFTLATVDSSAHLTALRDLVALFDDPAFFRTLDTAERPDGIINFIRKFEEEKERVS